MSELTNDELFEIGKKVGGFISGVFVWCNKTVPNWIIAHLPKSVLIHLTLVYTTVGIAIASLFVQNRVQPFWDLLIFVVIYVHLIWVWKKVLDPKSKAASTLRAEMSFSQIMFISEIWSPASKRQMTKFFSVVALPDGVGFRIIFATPKTHSDADLAARMDWFATQLKVVSYELVPAERGGSVTVDFYWAAPPLPLIDQGSVPYPLDVPNEK